MKHLLLNERWRPKTIEDMVLPNRIREYFKDGLQTNVILYGSFGTGKTTLARILIGKYSKENPYLELNTSLFTSIDDLRSKVYDFCVTRYIDLESDKDIDYTNKIKYVFLDEFDRASKQYQDALKGFVESMSSTHNIRFIFVTNHIDKISDGILSRMTCINFDTINNDEVKEVKNSMFNRIKDVILPEENINIDKKDIASIINSCFPDFRKTLSSIQDYSNNRQSTSTSHNKELIQKTIQMVLDKNLNYKDIYDFIFLNYGDANVGTLLKILGRDFINFVFNYNYDSTNLFKVNSIITDMESKLPNSLDPLVLAMATVGKIRELYT